MVVTIGGFVVAEIAAGASLAAAAAYLFWPGEGFVRAIVKTLAVGGLAIISAVNGVPWLAIALAFCAFGDFALARAGERWFLAGMLGFGIGHVLYALLFLQWASDITLLRGLCAIALLAVAVILGRAYSARAGDLAWPVRIYVALIACMGLAAISLPASVVIVGAGLFMLSDAIIGQQKFLNQTWPGQDAVIWITYYVGQLLILLGWLIPVPFLF